MSEIKPVTRREVYLAAMTDDSITPPEPQTAEECYLAAMSGNYDGELPEPQTREQVFMKAVADKGGTVQNVEWADGMDSFTMYEDGWWRTTIRKLVLPAATKISSNSCGGMNALETLIIPKGVEIIECGAFAACRSLKNVIIADTVTDLGATGAQGTGGAFGDCSSLEKIEIPGSVKTILGGTFSGCTALKTVVLNEGVSEVKGGAFSGCVALENISFPASLRLLDSGALAGANVKTIKFKGTPTTIDEGACPGATQITDIYVPWSEGEVANAPWGATNATIHYNYTGE